MIAEWMEEIRLSLQELRRSEGFAAALVALGVVLLCGNQLQVAPHARVEVTHRYKDYLSQHLGKAQSGEMYLNLGRDDAPEPAGIRVSWLAEIDCGGPELTVTVVLPGSVQNFSTPGLRETA